MTLSPAGNLGIGMTPTNVLDITQTQNSASIISLLNASSGVAANSRLYLGNATSATRGRLIQWGSSFTSTGVYRQDGLLLEGVGTGGVTINTDAQPIYFAINGTERARFDTSGNLCLGTTSANANLLRHQRRRKRAHRQCFWKPFLGFHISAKRYGYQRWANRRRAGVF